MLIDSIIHAQQGCDSDMMFLVSKFSGILKKHINNRRQIWHKIISFRLHCLDRSVKI